MMKKNSERNAAIRFMKKLFILFIPFIALLAVYFLDDPFMVLKNYERYDQTPVVLNEGHVGWQMYLNNRDTIPIDSYIMGNACTMAYQCHEWEKYLHGGRSKPCLPLRKGTPAGFSCSSGCQGGSPHRAPLHRN